MASLIKKRISFLALLSGIACVGFLSANASAGFFSKLKKKKVDAFAAANAEKVKEFAGAEGIHAPVKAGSCSQCHADPKDPSKLLHEGKALCLTCHKDRAEDMKKATVHSAFVDMECDTCHSPHSSKIKPLLNEPVNDLCTTCHDITEDEPKAAHAGISVVEGNCTGCHNPHASSKPKLILESKEHIPFESRSCDMCHAPTGADGKAALKETPEENCFVCHSNFRKLSDNPIVHMPAESGDCTTCHNPHVSPRSALMRAPMHTLCFECHEGWLKNNHPSAKHPTEVDGRADPRREGRPFNCASCHEPHAGKEPKLMRKNIFVLCKECHKK